VTTAQPSSNRTRFFLITAAILVLAAFLLGFIPQYQKASQLQSELVARDQRINQLQREAKLSRARDLAGLLYLELTRKNYGIAGQHASALFTHLREMLSDTTDPSLKTAIENIAGQRDAITASIAKADPSVETVARDILERMHQFKVP
jgi:hypothetical protein